MVFDNRHILHTGIEDQTVGILALVEGFNVLCVRFPLLRFESQIRIKHLLRVLKAAGGFIKNIQTKVVFFRIIGIIMILQLEWFLCLNLKTDNIVAAHKPLRNVCTITIHLRGIKHRRTFLDIGAVLCPQIIASHRFTVDDLADIITPDTHRLITDMLLAVAFHQLSVPVHLSVQLGHCQCGKGAFGGLQVADAVPVQVHACDKKGRCNQQKPEINNRLFASL